MKRPIHEVDFDWEIHAQGTSQELRSKALCDVGGRAKVGVGLLELPPKCDTKPAHWHSLEEEHLFVIAGRATLHLGPYSYELRPGSFVTFPANQEFAHYLQNTGADPFRYLMIGERIAGDEVHHLE
jgi:uncharacterized cupin superfamily protein